jgi:hypothetical protein
MLDSVQDAGLTNRVATLSDELSDLPLFGGPAERRLLASQIAPSCSRNG